MRSIQYLESNDIIQEGDFIRPLDLVYIGQSDVLETSSPYTGSPLNHTRWLQVERAGIPFWIGKTVGEFNKMSAGLEKPHQPSTRYEFVRGVLPKDAILGETYYERERRIETAFDAHVLTFGKYKGKTVAQLKTLDPSYVEFCLHKGYLKKPS